MHLQGPIYKMQVRLDSPVIYHLPVGEQLVAMNPYLGRTLRISFQGQIYCINCHRPTKKSFNQGYCYPCFTRLAQCDLCIVKPELCHYRRGTCREPEWGEKNCMIPHRVYLANSSGLKVGISRGAEPITRWIDQGASQGLVIRSVSTRFESGLVEVAYKKYVADRTDWRKMLRGTPETLDLVKERNRLFEQYRRQYPRDNLPGERCLDAEPLSIEYPVWQYPSRVASHNLDKNAVLEGTLWGIKGQYLILDRGVINIRKYAGYEITIEVN